MSSVTPSVGRHAEAAGGDPESASRRRAAVVAAIAGFAVPVWFWVTEGLFGLVGPPQGAAAGDYIDFYVENFSQLPKIATAYVGLWALILVLFIAVVRAAITKVDLAALVAVGPRRSSDGTVRCSSRRRLRWARLPDAVRLPLWRLSRTVGNAPGRPRPSDLPRAGRRTAEPAAVTS